MEIRSNIEHKKCALKVRRAVPQPSIFVRSFSAITILISFLSEQPCGIGDEYLRAIYNEANHVYAPFTSRGLHSHQK
jgi:hypothetical protein